MSRIAHGVNLMTIRNYGILLEYSQIKILKEQLFKFLALMKMVNLSDLILKKQMAMKLGLGNLLSITLTLMKMI